MSYHPRHAFLTHYGQIGNLPRHADEMHQLIDAHVAIAEKVRGTPADRQPIMETEILDLLMQRVTTHGCKLPPNEIRELLSLDAKLNAQGLASWLDSSKKH